MNAIRTCFVVQAILTDGYNHSNPFPPTRDGLTQANELALQWLVQRMVYPELHTNVIGFRVIRIRERIEA